MVKELVSLKAQGYPFERAWTIAQSLVPIRVPKERPLRDDVEAVPFHEFFYQACKREWNGEVECDFASLLTMLPSDDTRPPAAARGQATVHRITDRPPPMHRIRNTHTGKRPAELTSSRP